jgi:hypothetical protein
MQYLPLLSGPALTALAPVALACVGQLTACRRAVSEEERPPVAAAGRQGQHVASGATASGCRTRPFTAAVPIPEGSDLAYLAPGWGDGPAAGEAALAIPSDSGNHGLYVIISAADGRVLESGRLPLEPGSSDDIEGLSVLRGTLVGLTSAGLVRTWRRAPAGGYRRAGDSYLLRDRATPAREVSCADGARRFNCGRNYEGLCLRDRAPAGACIGYAAAKTDGTLYCLVEEPAGTASAVPHLVVDSSRTLRVAPPEVLSGCHFSPDGSEVWVGTNAMFLNAVLRVRNTAPAGTPVERIASLGGGFSEGIALGPGGIVYRISDAGTTPSLAHKYHCE